MNITITGLNEFIKSAGEFTGELENKLSNVMKSATGKIKSVVKSNLSSRGINTTYKLSEGISSKSSTYEGIVWSQEKYGVFVEYGTRPHFPPVAPLERWAQIKLGRSGLGYPIARKISRVGTKAQPFFHSAVDSQSAEVFLQFERLADDMVRFLAK